MNLKFETEMEKQIRFYHPEQILYMTYKIDKVATEWRLHDGWSKQEPKLVQITGEDVLRQIMIANFSKNKYQN
jgi:hypothetical protein